MADHAGHRASQGRFVDHSTGILRFQYPHSSTKSGPLFAFHAYEPRKDAKAQKGNTLGDGSYARHLIFEVKMQDVCTKIGRSSGLCSVIKIAETRRSAPGPPSIAGFRPHAGGSFA